jgi:hypothetical protein
MAYSDFTSLKQLEKAFNVGHKISSFLANSLPKQPTDKLLFDLQEASEMPLHSSEKAKSELLIMPILKEIRRTHKSFSIFSGYAFDVNPTLGLNGYCDYLLSTDTNSFDIASAVFCLVEATGGVPQNRSIEEGLGQVGAEMIAAQQFNDTENKPNVTVFGCVTNAHEWMFLKLENSTLTIDTERYYLTENDLSRLLGAWYSIMASIRVS